jgi:glycosyltransferase involved in cell wall biosynthesis
VRSSTTAAVVVDIGRASASAALLAHAADADVIVVASALDGEELVARERRLAGKVRILPAPVDLDRFAPEAVLNRLRGAYIKRFRRLHRLAHPSILFAGPYTRAGGLDLAIAATYRLREQLPDLRLAAIPVGGLDQRYLDQCEMDALALGHRGIIEWSASEDELPFWYATATVVVCPWREAAAARAGDITARAAAAGRPFLGVDLPVFRQSFRASGSPELVRPGDAGGLVDALAPLLTSLPTSDELGVRARSQAEAECSSAAAAAGLGAIWNGAAGRRG